MKILLIHGPNLNNLGQREPGIYGNESFASLNERLGNFAVKRGCRLDIFQSNHEGGLIDKIQETNDVNGMIINPGGLSHTSVSLRDCLASVSVPVIEVHISNIYAREEFRQKSLISPVVKGVVSGLGTEGYFLALGFLLQRETPLAKSL